MSWLLSYTRYKDEELRAAVDQLARLRRCVTVLLNRGVRRGLTGRRAVDAGCGTRRALAVRLKILRAARRRVTVLELGDVGSKSVELIMIM